VFGADRAGATPSPQKTRIFYLTGGGKTRSNGIRG